MVMIQLGMIFLARWQIRDG